jgi:hypothetical protein
MDVQIRPCASADEVRQAISPIGHYFGRSLPNDELAVRLMRFLPAERVYGAWGNGRAAGLGTLSVSFDCPRRQGAGGRGHRRGRSADTSAAGLLRGMMRALLDGCHREGDHLAYLWATEDRIYGRFGLGLASFTAEIDLPRERSAFHEPSAMSGRVRLVPLTAARRSGYGSDPWGSGSKANRRNDELVRYSLDQQLIDRPVAVE